MRVEVLFFSVLRDITGTDRLDWEAEVSTIGELVASLTEGFPGLEGWRGRLLLAVNGEYADPATPLSAGDEVALMPPVQGG